MRGIISLQIYKHHNQFISTKKKTKENNNSNARLPLPYHYNSNKDHYFNKNTMHVHDIKKTMSKFNSVCIH
jgi:hypothetical protein